MKALFRWVAKTFIAVIALALLLFVGVVVYVSLNKKKIIGQVTQEIGNKLNGKVGIGDVELSFFRNFPEISVLLKKVSVTDSMFVLHHHALLLADRIFVNISLMKLIKQEPPLKGILLKDGNIYLYTDTSGYTNTYLLKTKKDSLSDVTGKPAVKNELKTVILQDVHIIINDLKKEKLHDLLVNRMDLRMEDRDSLAFLFGVKADIQVNSLAFNLERGSFLKNKSFTGKFDMKFNKQTGQLMFDSINIKIAGHPFNLSGSFELQGDAPQFALEIHTRNVLYPFVRSLLPQKLDSNLSIVQVDKPVMGDARVTGPLKGGEPKIYITWSARNVQVKTPFLDFENASFEGYFTNEVVAGLPRRDPNSKIGINHFTADWHDLKLSSNRIEILDLYKPLLTCDLGSRFELSTLNNIIGSEAIRFKDGTGSIQVMYKGPLERNNNTNSFINGALSFSNALLLYAPRNVEMKRMNGKLTFRNSDVFVENLQCLVLNNQITMQGQAKNLLTLVNTEPGKASIDWKISTPSLDLSSFVYLLQSRNNKVASAKNKNRVADMAVKIDNLLAQCKLQVNLSAGKLLYKKFEASNTIADITLLEDRYLINKVSMDHAGGHLDLTGSLRNRKNNYHEALINATLHQMDVSKVFSAFENFGQDGITSESLEGKLNARVNASMAMDDNGRMVPASIVSRVDFSLTDGALNNYEPLKKLQRFVFKKRDFDNIRFAELKNTLEINKGEIKVNRMEIQSTVLSLFVEGLYAQQGNRTDMSIQVPLSNLKKRTTDYNPENIGTEARAGGSIFIRGRPGDDGTIKFKLDLFNKYNKEKKRDRIPGGDIPARADTIP